METAARCVGKERGSGEGGETVLKPCALRRGGHSNLMLKSLVCRGEDRSQVKGRDS